MFLYHDHCGSLDDGMKTTQLFYEKKHLMSYIRDRFGSMVNITSKYYAYDVRIDQYLWVIMVNGAAVGFTNKNPDNLNILPRDKYPNIVKRLIYWLNKKKTSFTDGVDSVYGDSLCNKECIEMVIREIIRLVNDEEAIFKL